MPSSRATASPQTPTGPGVATWMTSGRCSSMHASTSVGNGKRRSSDSYVGSGSDQSGGSATVPGPASSCDATTTAPAYVPSAAASARRRIVPATPFTSENVSVKRSARGSRGTDAAAGEELRLDRAEPAPRLRVVTGGGEIRELQSGGERERAEPAARARKLREGDAARAGALAEQAHEARALVGDLAMTLRRVVGVAVEELLDLRADRVRKLGAGNAIRVREERGDRVRELRRRPVRAADGSLAARDPGEELVDRSGTARRPRRRDVEGAVVIRSARERDAPAVRRLEPVRVGERGEERRRHRCREPARELVRLA